MFRIFNSLYGNGKGLAEQVYKNGHRRVVLVALNFGGAQEPAFAFKHTFQKLGGQVLAEPKPPLGTADWGPWVTQAGAGADAVVAYVYAADAIRMVKAWTEFGSKGKLPLYGARRSRARCCSLGWAPPRRGSASSGATALPSTLRKGSAPGDRREGGGPGGAQESHRRDSLHRRQWAVPLRPEPQPDPGRLHAGGAARGW